MLTRLLKEGSLMMVYTEFLQGTPLKGWHWRHDTLLIKPTVLLQHLSAGKLFMQNMNIPEAVFWPH